MEQLTQLISTVGFPIAVASYMIFYNNKTVTALTEAVQKLTIMMERK